MVNFNSIVKVTLLEASMETWSRVTTVQHILRKRIEKTVSRHEQ